MRHTAGLAALLLQIPMVSAQMPTELTGHTALDYSVTFSPDGKTLATAGFDGQVKLRDFAAGKEVKNLGAHTNSAYSVAFSPDGKLLVSASADGTAKVWDVVGQKELKTFKTAGAPVDPKSTAGILPPAAMTGALFTPDSKQV